MAEKTKPTFVTVDSLRPGTKGHNLHLKARATLASAPARPPAPGPGAEPPHPAQVIEAKVVLTRAKGPKGNELKVSECLVGDESGIIVFTARNEQGKRNRNAPQREVEPPAQAEAGA
jgi:replication factor A1